MTITRDGKTIELTAEELSSAYYEQQHIFDKDDVSDYFTDHWYEPTDEEKTYFEQHIDEIAKEYRRLEDSDRTSDWWDSAESAIEKAFENMENATEQQQS